MLLQRITIPEIFEDPWFQINYVPACVHEDDEKKNLDDVSAAFDGSEVNIRLPKLEMISSKSVNDSAKFRNSCEQDKMDAERMMPKSSSFINAFQLIAMSNDLDLSGLFEEEVQ